MGPVPRLRTDLAPADLIGALRVRVGIGRSAYRVRPGLYAIGSPDDHSPVLVTANYKSSVDAVRSSLTGRSAWLLVLDTHGVNVWCAAGKGTFSTETLVRAIRATKLSRVVEHRRLILPQLGATGVAARVVRAMSGYTVTWGPVRSDDLPAFIDAGCEATEVMRTVRFAPADRAVLIGVELGALVRPRVVGPVLVALTFLFIGARGGEDVSSAVLIVSMLAAGLVSGMILTPVFLPLIPGRPFALKGAICGAVACTAVASVLHTDRPALAMGLALVAVALASYFAMNFTGSSTFTSPSGVEWEMRRAIPLQVSAAVIGVVVVAVALLFGGW